MSAEYREEQKLPLVSLSYQKSTTGPTTVNLRIEDGPSGLCLFDGNMDAETFVNFLSSLVQRIDGKRTNHPERIGMQHVCETFAFKMRDNDKYNVVPAWVTKEVEKLLAEGWQECDTPRRDNAHNWVVVARKWESPS